MKQLWIVPFIWLLAGFWRAWALDEQHEESGKVHTEQRHEEIREVSSNVGPGKAVTEADPARGFRLSDQAVQRLGIKTIAVRSLPLQVPGAAVVYSREESGIYRLRDGWYRLIHGSIDKKSNGTAAFLPERKEELKLSDQIVIESAGLLRVAELAAFESGGGHHH